MKYINSTITQLLLILITVTGLYWQTRNYDFVLDDTIVIKENNFVQKGIEGIPEILNNDAMTGYLGGKPNLLAGGRYRPLSLVVFAIGYEIFGLNTYWFHILNILFYLLCCMLLFYTLSRLFNFAGEKKEKFQPLILLGTLIFAAHPAHTEAVANIKGLDEILTALFGLLALWATLIYVDNKKKVYLILSWISIILSFLAKESTIPLIIAIPVALYFFRNATLKQVFNNFLLFLIPTVIYLFIRYNVMGFLLDTSFRSSGIMNDPFYEATLNQRIGTIIFILVKYLKLLFFPHPLTHDYYPYQIELIKVYHPLALVSLAILSFLIVYAAKGIKNRNKIAYTIFFFFASISIVSNVIINVGTFMNERFLFIPSIAMVLLLLVLYEKYQENNNLRNGIIFILLFMFSAYSVKSYTRIPAWKDALTLNSASIKVSKNSARANCFYAVALFNDQMNDSVPEIKLQKLEEAAGYLEKALKIYPVYKNALNMKAGVASEKYKEDENLNQLLNEFKEVLAVRPIDFVDEFTDWVAHHGDRNILADYYFDVGYGIYAVKKKDFKKAGEYLKKGFSLNNSHKNLIFGNCIVGYFNKNYKSSIGFGRAYIKKYGEDPEILFYTGHSLLNLKDEEAGRQYIKRAIALKPELKNRKTN